MLLASFVLTGRGLGASGTFKHVQAVVLHVVNPTWAEENGNIGGFFADPGRSSPLDAWIVWLSLGLGGGRRGRRSSPRVASGSETVRGPRARGREPLGARRARAACSPASRRQLARGCTSGQALTGGAQLALGSWVFMFSVFGGAYGLAWFVRKQWI